VLNGLGRRFLHAFLSASWRCALPLRWYTVNSLQ
jgi:hypothetical protein